MNERDKELAKQAWTENDWDGHVDIPKLIQLIRADERERIKVAKSPKLFFALTNLTKGIGKGELYCFGAGINAGKEKNT